MNKIAVALIICVFLVGCGMASSQVTNATKEVEVKASSVNVGESVKMKDFAQWTVTAANFSKKFSPSKQSRYVTYYENTEDGHTYLDIIILMTNLKKEEEISDQFATVTIQYNGKEEYGTCATVEDAEGQDFEFSNVTMIEPNETRTLHYYASVPEEMANDEKPLKIIITCKDQTYELVIRE